MADRASFVPRHGSLKDNVLPNDPLFLRLLTIAHNQNASKPLIRDLTTGVEATASTLLSDILNLRRRIAKCLSSRTLEDLRDGKDVFISISAGGGYEFAVGILAILALGACASLLSPAMPPSELAYYIEKTQSSMILVSAKGLPAAEKLESQFRRKGRHFVAISLSPSTMTSRAVETVALSSIIISSNPQPDPNKPGIIIFTSGTTGPPKAVVLRRYTITTGAQALAGQLDLQPTDTLLHLLPVHHATGVNLSFFPFLQAGACIEFKQGGFDPQWTWDRWRRGDLTHFTGVPTIYMRMMRHWEQHISNLSSLDQQGYRNGAAQIKIMFCGTSALPRPIDRFWADIRNGRRIIQRYGSTETQIAVNMPITSFQDVPEGSVGKASVGVELRIAGVAEGGDGEGELLVKSPYMFACYLNDESATRAAHDEHGYFKTGDMARKQGEYYFILGRASVDILKSGGYKISALDIEREILGLPYVQEVMVIGVPDDEFGQRVAAVITLRKHPSTRASPGTTGVTLDSLRTDLRSRLAGYKLPTLLRVVDGELPKNATGKVVKKNLGPLYFPDNYAQDPRVQTWKAEERGSRTMSKI